MNDILGLAAKIYANLPDVMHASDDKILTRNALYALEAAQIFYKVIESKTLATMKTCQARINKESHNDD